MLSATAQSLSGARCLVPGALSMVRDEEDVSRVMSNYGQLLADRAAGAAERAAQSEAARSAAASPAPSPTMQPPGMLSGCPPFWIHFGI